jgi:hypothetical protein
MCRQLVESAAEQRAVMDAVDDIGNGPRRFWRSDEKRMAV